MVDTPRTTCVACIIQDDAAYWAHAGDSRLYMLRDAVEFPDGSRRTHTRVLNNVGDGAAILPLYQGRIVELGPFAELVALDGKFAELARAQAQQSQATREAARLMREHLAQLESQLQFESPPDDAPDLMSLFGAVDA